MTRVLNVGGTSSNLVTLGPVKVVVLPTLSFMLMRYM